MQRLQERLDSKQALHRSPPAGLPECAMSQKETDRAFFTSEIERLMGSLYGTALRLTRNRADAEDLVSETVTKAWPAFGKLADRQCFHKWLLRILTNTFISNRRHFKPDTCVGVDTNDENACFSLFEKMHQPFLLWWSNPEQELINKLLHEDIEAAIDKLPADFRAALILIEINSFSYAEAADTLGVPIGTVRSRLSRARSMLQRDLWQQAEEAGLTSARPKVADA